MQYPGKAPPQFVEPHRLEPDASSRPPGLAPIDAATLAALHAIGRRPPPRERVRRVLAMVVAIILHIFLVLVVRYEMTPRPLVGYAVPDDRNDVLEVRFIEPARSAPPVETPPPPPVTEPPPKVRSPEATRPEPRRPKEAPKDQTSAPAAADTPAPPAQQPALFGADGAIVLPKQGRVPRRPRPISWHASQRTTAGSCRTRPR